LRHDVLAQITGLQSIFTIVQAGYFLTFRVLINITAIYYACVCYPFDPYFDYPNTAMEPIITPDKESDQVTYICNFPVVPFTRGWLGCTCIYNFTLWFTCRY